MAHELADVVAYIAIALASFAATWFALVRLGKRWVAAACLVVMLLLKLLSIQFLDLEPIGEPSSFRSNGLALPVWLIGLGYFNGYASWGALAALFTLQRRRVAQ